MRHSNLVAALPLQWLRTPVSRRETRCQDKKQPLQETRFFVDGGGGVKGEGSEANNRRQDSAKESSAERERESEKQNHSHVRSLSIALSPPPAKGGVSGKGVWRIGASPAGAGGVPLVRPRPAKGAAERAGSAARIDHQPAGEHSERSSEHQENLPTFPYQAKENSRISGATGHATRH